VYDAVSALLQDKRTQRYRPLLGSTLKKFGQRLLGEVVRADIRFCFLQDIHDFEMLPLSLRERAIALDEWPDEEAGYFSARERTIYLRSLSTRLVAHELAHAVDYALGGGKYYSENTIAITSSFQRARWFISPWAGSSRSDYFAENLRFYIGAETITCHWRNRARKRLQRLDPDMFDILERLFHGDQ
jgi:hypothetical protein